MPSERGMGRGHLSEMLKQRNEEIRVPELACQLCGAEQPRENFWPADLANRFSAKSGKLGCRACRPLPPDERRPKRSATAADLASASTSEIQPQKDDEEAEPE